MTTPQNLSGRPAPTAPQGTPVDGMRQAGVGRRPLPHWAVPVVAAVVGVVAWLCGTAAGADLVVQAGGATQEVGIVAVVLTALVVGYAGWGVRSLLRLLPSGGERAWLVTCAVVLLVSLLGPIGAASLGTVGVLIAMHVGVGAALALGLRR